MSKTAERIKECRLEKGMSVEKLADILGKNRATVYRYESDFIETIPYMTIVPLAKALDVDPAYLMAFTDEKGPFIKNEQVEADSNDQHSELISLFDQLPADRKAMVMSYVRFQVSEVKQK